MEYKTLAVTKYGAKWVNDADRYDICFDCSGMKEAVAYLLSNCFFLPSVIHFFVKL